MNQLSLLMQPVAAKYPEAKQEEGYRHDRG